MIDAFVAAYLKGSEEDSESSQGRFGAHGLSWQLAPRQPSVPNWGLSCFGLLQELDRKASAQAKVQGFLPDTERHLQ